MHTQVRWIETGVSGRVGVMPRPRGGDWLEDELAQLRREGVEVLVSLLTHEEQEALALTEEPSLAKRAGLEFLTLPIRDRQVPDDLGATEALVSRLALAVKAGRSVVVHCRMGIGRASLIAAAVLVRLGVTGEAALARISLARGLEVPDTAEQRAWVLAR